MHTELLSSINALRRDNGLGALQPNQLLDQAAQAYADDLAAMDADYDTMKSLGHRDSRGTGPVDRAKAAGYPQHVIENALLAGSEDPQAAYEAWLGSPGHKANMLQPWAVESGLGVAHSISGRVYLVNVIGGPYTAFGYDFDGGDWVEAQPQGRQEWQKGRITGRGKEGNRVKYRVDFVDDQYPTEMIWADENRIREA